MAKVYKDIYIDWDWTGDNNLLKGFNVGITPSSGDPKHDAIIIQKTSAEKTDIKDKGTEQYEHIFRNVILEKGVEHIAWVQALTEGDDSDWLSTNKMVVTDDGVVTIETIVGSQEKANIAENNAKEYADDELSNFVSETYSVKISELETKVDDTIDTHFAEYEPTLSNDPTINWDNDSEKDLHLGDLFYNTDSGYSYLFAYTASNGYFWSQVSSSEVTQALETANEALGEADSKMRVFYSQPTPPYEVNDLWSQGAGGDLMICVAEKIDTQNFSSSDWEKAVQYTDDSALNNFVTDTYTPEKQNMQIELDGKIETHFTSTDPSNNWSVSEKEKHHGDMWFNTSNQELKRYNYSINTWELIRDQKAIDAYNTASTAKDTADEKRRVFTQTPFVPYDIGDLWQDPNENDFKVCKVAKGDSDSYSSADWEYATNVNTTLSNLQFEISEYSDDNKIALSESNGLKATLAQIVKESEELESEGLSLGLSTKTTNYTDAVLNLQTYLNNNWIDQTGYPLDITDTERSDLQLKLETVQSTKVALQNSISQAKADTAEQNAKEHTDTLENSLGGLAYDNVVEQAKLGTTVVDGGYIVTDLLNADRITTGTLNADVVSIGGGTNYDSDYDPSTKETPTGAQEKADTAEGNAKGYADHDAKWVSDNSQEDANISSAGWYRIAMNTGNRANATFKLRDTESGHHNTVEFKLGCSYNRVSDADFQMTSFSRYGLLTFSKVRLLTNGTYDEMYVEIYLESSADVRCEITDNIQNDGWHPVDWSSGYIPSGYSSTEWNIDVNTITIDGDGIKTVGLSGDYSILTDDSLAFYESGSSTPHWYTKRVAYGTAQDGDYIDLQGVDYQTVDDSGDADTSESWNKAPKVMTSIKSLTSYNKNYDGDTQQYSSYVSSISKDGFYVHGRSVIPSGTEVLDNNYSNSVTWDGANGAPVTFSGTYTSDWSNQSTVSNILADITFRVEPEPGNGWNVMDANWSLTIKYETDGGTVYTHDSVSVYESWFYTGDYTTETLYSSAINIATSDDKYRLIVEWSLTGDIHKDNFSNPPVGEPSIYINNQETKAEITVDNGEVSWIAIEGGAE